jgi:peptidoglycan/xylan/chitin deacetylase (PgdA/CDA1 family)
MGYTAKERIWVAADTIFLNRLLTLIPRQNGWSILCAHGISDGPTHMPSHDDRFVEVATFREEMKHLLSLGHEFITLTEGIRRMEAGSSLRKTVTVTFDDGLRTVIDLAYPVMRELGVRGCIYVVTDIVGTKQLLWTDLVTIVCWHRKGKEPIVLEFPDRTETFSVADERAVLQSSKTIIGMLRAVPDDVRRRVSRKLDSAFEEVPESFVPAEYRQTSWEQLKGVDPAVLEIGSHTVSHPKLAALDAQNLRNEIFDAKGRIERELGRPADHFCYPGGVYSPTIVECVRASGHRSATTTEYGRNGVGTPSLELRRFILEPSLPRFKSRMSGLERIVDMARRPRKLFRFG